MNDIEVLDEHDSVRKAIEKYATNGQLPSEPRHTNAAKLAALQLGQDTIDFSE